MWLEKDWTILRGKTRGDGGKAGKAWVFRGNTARFEGRCGWGKTGLFWGKDQGKTGKDWVFGGKDSVGALPAL